MRSICYILILSLLSAVLVRAPAPVGGGGAAAGAGARSGAGAAGAEGGEGAGAGEAGSEGTSDPSTDPNVSGGSQEDSPLDSSGGTSHPGAPIGSTGDPTPEPENEPDINEIVEKVHDLIDLIASFADGSSSATPTPTISVGSPQSVYLASTPSAALGCFSVSSVYSVCSSQIASFASLATTHQASCLCTVSPASTSISALALASASTRPFDDYVRSCAQYASSQTGSSYQSYATAIASGEFICADVAATSAAASGSIADGPVPTVVPTSPSTGKASFLNVNSWERGLWSAFAVSWFGIGVGLWMF